MQAALVPKMDAPARLPSVPWRDPHSVSRAQLSDYIGVLEKACEEDPESPDLRVCLGVAYAMDFEAYKSMDALERAILMDPTHFFAQLKYAELLYRLRVLLRAEQETLKAVDLAQNSWELSLARKQLQQIRERMREGTQRPAWVKPLKTPVLMLALGILLMFLVMWK